MPVRLAIPAVIALNARLDQARAVRRRQDVLVVAGMRGELEQAGRIGRARRGLALHAGQRLAHERPERVFVHAPTSTASMMPMMAASTAAAFLPRASPAALPSITTSTLSPMPAPTESMASSVVPRGVSSSVRGWTSISFAPSSFLFFCVDTTVTTTRQICISATSFQLPVSSFQLPDFQIPKSQLFQIPVVDDADDGGVGGRLGGIEGKRGLTPAHEEDVLPDAGPDRIERHERAAGGFARGRERLQDEHLEPGEAGILHRRHDFTQHPGELHGASPSPRWYRRCRRWPRRPDSP